ncbi:hypothetical protein LTR22_026337, partial [Elasticomyces elasticus]
MRKTDKASTPNEPNEPNVIDVSGKLEEPSKLSQWDIGLQNKSKLDKLLKREGVKRAWQFLYLPPHYSHDVYSKKNVDS